MSSRKRLGGAGPMVLASGVLALLVLAPFAEAAQLPVQAAALNNDSYLPVSNPALEQLRLGDGECLGALAGGPGQELAWTRCFEAWHAALVLSLPGDNVPVGIQLRDQDAVIEGNLERVQGLWPDRDHSFGRRTEAVEYAILRRLCALDTQVVAQWSTRFEALAATALEEVDAVAMDTTRRRVKLAEIERRFPATRSGMRASLQLLEIELESGREHAARGWQERAALHAALIAGSSDSDLHLALQRRAALIGDRGAPRALGSPPWSRAKSFAPDGGHSLLEPGFARPASRARIEGQPGLAFLDEERVAVQTTGTTWVLSSNHKDRIFEPWKLGLELGQPIPGNIDRVGKDWPMFPVARGESLFLVSGRTDGTRSNLVQRIRTPRELELPIAQWSLGGKGLFGPEGKHTPLDQVLEEGLWEFQPGPLLIDDLLFVQARQWMRTESEEQEQATLATPGEARSWLLALDAQTGMPRWKRFLCRGTEVRLDFGTRFGNAPLLRTPACALQATDRSVFVGTNLGAGFLLDMADGRLRWSFRNRRREPDQPGWQTGARPQQRLQADEGAPQILWAPADSDELYDLGSALDFGPAALGPTAPLIRNPPLPISESEQLIGGSPTQVLTFGRAGARKTLSAQDLTSGRRVDSIYLGRGETYLPGVLLSEDRLLFAAEGGLYCLDRKRELYLTNFQPLAISAKFSSGGLWFGDGKLYLLAEGSLYRFKIE